MSQHVSLVFLSRKRPSSAENNKTSFASGSSEVKGFSYVANVEFWIGYIPSLRKIKPAEKENYRSQVKRWQEARSILTS